MLLVSCSNDQSPLNHIVPQFPIKKRLTNLLLKVCRVLSQCTSWPQFLGANQEISAEIPIHVTEVSPKSKLQTKSNAAYTYWSIFLLIKHETQQLFLPAVFLLSSLHNWIDSFLSTGIICCLMPLCSVVVPHNTSPENHHCFQACQTPAAVEEGVADAAAASYWPQA